MRPEGTITARAPAAPPPLDVWYICDLSLCNFDCGYCVSGSPETGGSRTRKRVWKTDDGPDRLRRILRWIAGLPYAVGLRLQTIGEPFVSDEFLAEASRMTNERNVRFVELVTNGSLLTSRLPKMRDEYRADLSKLTLWITFHHTETTIEHLIENAAYAKQQGVFVVVNALLFPDSIEPIAKLHEQCEINGLPTNVDLGQGFNDAYQGLPFIPIAAGDDWRGSSVLAKSSRMALISVIAAASPKGLNCSAGHDYIYINPAGAVFPCLGYMRYFSNSQLGSALDADFVLRLRAKPYQPCGIDTGCTCKEDFLHLEAVQPGTAGERSLGYCPPDSEQPLDPSLLERIRQVEHSGILVDEQFWKRHVRARATPA
jgi:MoaA/NifB/PqqE/SkfB family radical SAM enzyme